MPRNVDRELEQAVAAPSLVLLVGPERSGKTRAAYEAARKVVPGKRVLVPEDGEALSRLVEEGNLRPTEGDVLWLDDLERFIPSLGAAELRALTASPATVATTIRSAAYRELLDAGGERGERGRRLLSRARTVQMDDGEALGRELSAGWQDQHVPLAGRPSAPAPEARSRLRWRDPVLGLALLLTVGGGATLAALVATGGFTTPSVGQQLDDIRERAADHGQRVVARRDVELHGTRSHVLVLRSKLGTSDELRVYDEGRSGRLRRKLTSRPSGKRLAFAPLELAGLDDVDDDGNREVVADYKVPSPGEAILVRVPIIVAWDDAAGHYVLSPLLTKPPRFPRSHRGRPLFGGRPYLFPFAIHSRKAYGATSFVVVPAAKELFTGIEQFEQGATDRARLAMSVYSLDLPRGLPELVRLCDPLRSTAAFDVQVPIRLAHDYRDDLRRVGPVAASRFGAVEFHGRCTPPD